MDYLGRPLAEAAAARLAPLLDLARADLVAPVPLHWWRRCRRGFNQAHLLADPIARRAGLPLAAGILSRPRAGRRQLGLTRRERLGSLEGCFAAGPPWPAGRLPARRAGRLRGPPAGRSVLLVDDVMTTGATLEACARALLRGGAVSVTACVLARTPRRRNS
jgi:predicted amidophosphoribosyltransferase